MNSRETNSSKVGGKITESRSKNTDSIRGRAIIKDSSRIEKAVHYREANSSVRYFSKDEGFRCLGTGPGEKIKNHKK